MVDPLGVPHPQGCYPPAQTGISKLPAQLLQDLVEEMIPHDVELVGAARATGGRAGPALATSRILSWTSLCELLKHLVFKPTASCPWRRLGFAPLEGPEPTLHGLAVRFRTPKLFCSAAQSPEWTPPERVQAAEALLALELARQQCSDLLLEISRERRRLRPPALPLWQELGASAMRLLGDTAPASTEIALTQWSEITLEVHEAQALHGGTAALEASRS
ncbi:unnamed protein product, partial [Prorocentrum cordatum]